MKSNGFIATSILYTFFLIFITLFVALITNYIHNQVLIATIDEASWEILDSIKNNKISDLKVGDHIRFANDLNSDGLFMNEEATWVVAYIQESNEGKIYYFFSDLSAQLPDISYKLSTDSMKKYHASTIAVVEEILSDKTTNAYSNSLQFKQIDFNLITTSMLKNVRDQPNVSVDILDAILGTDGSYVVKNQENQYFHLKKYTFPLGEKQSYLVSSYCGGSYNGEKVNYNSNNTFGYIHIDNNVNNINYVDYCLYASPVSYTHNKDELVVEMNEKEPKGDIISSLNSALYSIRLMGTLNIGKSDPFISGGRGTIIDPYLLTDGVKKV